MKDVYIYSNFKGSGPRRLRFMLINCMSIFKKISQKEWHKATKPL